jgi:hypothetical protein
MRSPRSLEIKPLKFQLGTAYWVDFLQAKCAQDETLSAVEMATEFFDVDDVKLLLLSKVIVIAPANYGICLCESVIFSFQDPETQAYRRMLPHGGPGSKLDLLTAAAGHCTRLAI